MVTEIDDQARRRGRRPDAEVDLVLDSDRPAEDCLEIAGANKLLHDRRPGARAGDALRPLVDHHAFVGPEVEAGCGVHPYEHNRAALDLDRISRAILLERALDVLDAVAGQVISELEDDAVVALMPPDGNPLEQRRAAPCRTSMPAVVVGAVVVPVVVEGSPAGVACSSDPPQPETAARAARSRPRATYARICGAYVRLVKKPRAWCSIGSSFEGLRGGSFPTRWTPPLSARIRRPSARACSAAIWRFATRRAGRTSSRWSRSSATRRTTRAANAGAGGSRSGHSSQSSGSATHLRWRPPASSRAASDATRTSVSHRSSSRPREKRSPPLRERLARRHDGYSRR